MMCVNCQKHVHDALLAMDGVSAVDVNLEKGTAKVTASREIPMDEFRSCLLYTSRSVFIPLSVPSWIAAWETMSRVGRSFSKGFKLSLIHI